MKKPVVIALLVIGSPVIVAAGILGFVLVGFVIGVIVGVELAIALGDRALSWIQRTFKSSTS
jgi:hypothetical protein